MRVLKTIVKPFEESEYPPGHPGHPLTPVKLEDTPILIRNEDDPIVIDSDDEEDVGKCLIDHKTFGFEGQVVYIWDGKFKGKLGRVLQMSGGIVKIGFEAAIHGFGISFIQAGHILAYVSSATHF